MLKKIFLFILLLSGIVSFTLNLYFYQYIKKQNTVIKVVDGDTFQLISGKRVRLLGVDAPEYDRCGGKEARQRLKELILNKVVRLKEEQPESFGRSLALVYQNNRFINQIILQEGWGVPDYRKNSQREKLTRAYHQAKEKKRGIFTLCKEKPDKKPPNPNCLIKGNIDKNTYQKFYHLPQCQHYNQIVLDKDIGERYFCSEEEAQKAGFVKASGCP